MSKKVMIRTVIVLVGLLLLALVLPVLHANKPVRMVETGSMSPTLPVWSIIMINQQDSYKSGDIITFRADEGKVVTHRVVGVNEDGSIQTKGDANLSPDNWANPITKEDVDGKVAFVFLLLSPTVWKTPFGVICAALLIIIIAAAAWPNEKQKTDVDQAE